MKKLKEEIKNDKANFLKLVYLILYMALTFELFNRPLIGKVRNLKIFFDDKIPFIKELILVYHTFIIALIVVALILFVKDKKLYNKYLLTLFISQNFAYLIYLFFQTEVPRYVFTTTENDIFSRLIKYTYSIDNNYSGAPSLHVANCLIAVIYLKKSNIKNTIKISFILYLILIALTTVLVKQHVFLDIPFGIIHGIIVYLIVWKNLINKIIIKE